MDTPRLLSLLVLVGILPLPAAASPPPRPPVFYRTVVQEGDPVPGVDGAAFTGFPYSARINDRGEVAFFGQARRGQTPGVFRASPDDPAVVTPVALIGAQAPGFAPGVVFRNVDQNHLRINRHGHVLFEATLEGPGIDGPEGSNLNARSAWLWNGGAPRPLFQYGTTPLGGPGEVVGNANGLKLNDLGHVAFFGASYVPGGPGGSGKTGVWYSEAGNLRQLARQDTVAPGTNGMYFRDFYAPALSSNGRLAFGADLQEPGNFARSGVGLYFGTADDFRVVAYPGAPAPGAAPGTTIHSVSGDHYDVSDRGTVIFRASTSAASAPAMYAGEPGALRLLAGAGTPAPGLPQGVMIDGFGKPFMNDRGDYAFSADTAAGDVTGTVLYAGAAEDGPRLVAASSRRPPGVAGDVFFREFGEPELNDVGQVAFVGILGGPEARALDHGLFATDPSGQLHLIARAGDPFELAPGDVRTIRNTAPGFSSVVSFEGDELVFTLGFTDGHEGIFTARLVPEPSALVALTAAGALALRRGRRF